ncbi:MAG: hypothetical protein Q8L88_02640 [Bacteroidota bacterium]|nr:hypothetical protein [Bacteroidota bacterium]
MKGFHMTETKQKAIDLIKSLPDQSTIDDIISELHFKIQVDTGLQQLDNGKGILHSEVEKRFEKWLTK